jgi:voltage-gated potassium channel
MIGHRVDVDATAVTTAQGATTTSPPWAFAARIPWTPARAVRAIAAVTLLVTLASGATMCVVDHQEFPTLGRGLWWAAQTVSTVGYGDVVPRATSGRLVAVLVMLCALAFLTVVTAAITATLLEGTRRRLRAGGGSGRKPVTHADLYDRLTQLEETLRQQRLGERTQRL